MDALSFLLPGLPLLLRGGPRRAFALLSAAIFSLALLARFLVRHAAIHDLIVAKARSTLDLPAPPEIAAGAGGDTPLQSGAPVMAVPASLMS